MSAKPQEPQADGPEDLLEQVFTQGLEKIGAPTQTAAGGETAGSEAPSAPEQENGAHPATPAKRETRQSTVYIYLLVLFGAAFLMLLLAYFVQRRSSESDINDLRESMNLSRTELEDEIRELEERNAALENLNTALDKKFTRLNRELAMWQPQHDETSLETLDFFFDSYYFAQEELYSWELFWELERYYLAEDYEGCAAILILRDQGQYSYRTPDAALERDNEIVLATINAGILQEDYYQHPEDYKDLMSAFVSRFYVSSYVSRETER